MLKQLSPIVSRVIHQIRRSQTCNISYVTYDNLGSRTTAPLHEPPYLEALKPPYPTYDVINVKMSGYDFPVLESYQRFVHRIAEALSMDVSECWAHPPKKENIVRYKPNSAIIESEYKLTTYERFVQISDVLAPTYPLFVRFIQSGLPEGVTLSVVHHTDVLEESRYVPDKDLLDLKSQLTAAGGPTIKKKKMR